MSSIIIDITREDSSSVDAELLLGIRGQTGLSAYEYAVMQGYSGTENDFSVLMASYATVAEAAAESASESAQSAVESAQSADASEGYASDAETSMNSASDYASAARASATSASQSAGVASGKADEAGESATSASNSADAAASSASSASTSASSASASASNASASATAAAGSATSASADADRAEDAKEFLENASATATALPEGSSPSVTLNDGVFNFAIPKGDTGARGEKGDTGSKGDKGDTGDTGSSAGFGTVSASVDDSTGTPSVEVTTSGTDTAKNFAFAFHNLKGAKGDKGDDGTVPDLDLILPTDTASGDIASITDGQNVVPVKSLKVTLEPIQSGSGTPSPSNVRPISGHTEVNTIVSPTTSASDGTTYTTTLGRTVYGGTLDVVSGELVVEAIKVKASDCNISLGGTSDSTKKRAYFYGLPNAVKNIDPTLVDGLMRCNVFEATTANRTYTKVEGISVSNNSNGVYAYKDDLQTVADWQTFIEANDMEFTYTLATPQTYQLDAQTISLLHGNNNVWSDGEVELTYNADVQLWVLKQLGTSGTTTLSMTRTLAKTDDTESDVEFTKSDNIQLAEDIIEKGDKVDDISKEDAL